MELFKLFLIFYLFILTSFFLGQMIIPVNAKNTFESLFKKIFLGSSLIIIVYAILMTHFKSIYIILAPTLLCFFKLKLINLKPSINKNEILKISFAAIISFLFISLYAFDYKNGNVKLTFYDYNFYSEISRGLSKSGIESIFSRFHPIIQPEKMQLYHYFDLWNSSFISLVFKTNNFDTLMMITYPFFHFLTILGICSFVEKRQKRNSLVIIYSFALTFILTLDISSELNLEILSYSKFISPSNYSYLKLLNTYPFILIALHSLLNKKYLNFTIVIIILATIYNTLIISLIPSLLIFTILLIFTKNIYKPFIALVIYLLTFSLFYIIFIYESKSIITQEIFLLKDLQSNSIVLIEYIIKNLTNYLPITILLLYLFIQNKKVFFNNIHLILFSITSLIIALTFSSVFHGTRDYNQALYNLLPLISLITLIFIVLKVKFNILINIFLIFIFSSNIHSFFQKLNNNKTNPDYCKTYVSNCMNLLENEKDGCFLIFNSEAERWEYNYNELATFTSKLNNISSGFNVALDFNNINQKSFFGDWCLNNQKEISLKSLTEFMSFNEIKYLFVNIKDLNSYDIEKYFKVLFTDSIKSEALIKLKK